MLTRPDFSSGELRRQPYRKSFDCEALAGEVPNQNERDAFGFGSQASVERGLANYQCIALPVDRCFEQFTCASACDCDALKLAGLIPDDLDARCAEELLRRAGKIIQPYDGIHHTDTACTDVDRCVVIRHERLYR